MKNLLWICLLATAVSYAQTREYSAAAFKQQLEENKQIVLIDLRTPEEVSKGIIPGAMVIDFFF